MNTEYRSQSRRRLTNSRVTTPALDWTGNSGRPSLVDTGVCLVKDCLTRSESTRPTVVPRFMASSLAADKTSSSRSIVVRMVSSQRISVKSMHLMFDQIKHHAQAVKKELMVKRLKR